METCLKQKNVQVIFHCNHVLLYTSLPLTFVLINFHYAYRVTETAYQSTTHKSQAS